MSQEPTAVSVVGSLSDTALESGVDDRASSLPGSSYIASCPEDGNKVRLNSDTQRAYTPNGDGGQSSRSYSPGFHRKYRIPIAKARPFATGFETAHRATQYKNFEPKIRTMIHTDLSATPKPGGNIVTVPVACRSDSFSTLGSHEGHHHSSPSRPTDKSAPSFRIETSDCYKFTKDNNQTDLASGENGGIIEQQIIAKRQLSEPETALLQYENPQPVITRQLDSTVHQQVAHNFIPSSATLHAPVPVSRVRPFFQAHHASEHEGHETTSKLRAAEGDIEPRSMAGEPYFDSHSADTTRPLSSRPSQGTNSNITSGSQSFGSVLDYKRTTRWLRDVLGYPNPYLPKFTQKSSQTKSAATASPEQKKKSESVLSLIVPPRFTGRSSTLSGKQSSKFDGIGFKRAVSDLERLLNEALAIASQVVEQPEHLEQQSYSQIPEHIRGLYRSDPSVIPLAKRYRPALSSTSTDGSSGDVEPLPLRAEPSPRRPVVRHAITSSILPRRPRLNEIIQNYSGQGSEIRPMENDEQHAEAVATGHASTRAFEIPRRKSSKNMIQNKSTKDDMVHPNEAHDHESGREYSKEVVVQLGTHHKTRNQQAKSSERNHARTHRSNHAEPATGEDNLPERDIAGRPLHTDHGISLRRRSHVSLRGAQGFSLAKSHKRQPVARDWSPARKRFVAAVACASTALIGIILGIYAGLVPSIQYYVIDQSHVTVHGNTGCFIGLALPTFFLWPLPLLHGRKPYILSSLVLAMPLLFPQALSVNAQRLTNTVSWRSLLLAARALMGACLGFASMNFHSILTDLFGASLMSSNPHQEVVDDFDARRHGGGMGVWLGIWTWCWVGSLGLGFLIGACIIDSYPPTWGFYVSIMIIAVVLFLNVVCPEVRRSAFRRSVAEVRTGEDISRRVARGEIMMHRVKTGPKWWGEEVYHGIALNFEMLRQPGFAILTVYSAWIYAQVVLIIVLLGSLTSRYYKLRSTDVGLFVGCMALGAFLAIPFQKAGLFSRSRQAQLNSNLATLERKVAWSSHLVRRAIFTLLLPLAGICYAAVSFGPPMHVSVPTTFSGFVGFLSCLAVAECNGLVMEAFDCSDLSPGMTGRQRGTSGKKQKRTNYSSFPRVTAGFAAIHSLAFIFAAGSTALGGHITRTLGQQVATGIVAGILLILSILLLLILIRFTEVQIVPKSKSEEMDRLVEARRRSTVRRASMPNDAQAIIDEEKAWRPAMIGNPTSKKRRMNIFELGSLTRWQEIRKKNKLIDTGIHLNRVAWDQGLEALDDQLSDIRKDAHELFHGKKRNARKHHRTDESSDMGSDVIEMQNVDMHHRHGGDSERASYQERDCVMSQTVDEENEQHRKRHAGH